MIGVLIVDDHQVVRQGLRFLLEQEDGIQVIGECADGPSAIQAVRTLEPTVVSRPQGRQPPRTRRNRIDVLTGAPGELSFVGCGQGGFILRGHRTAHPGAGSGTHFLQPEVDASPSHPEGQGGCGRLCRPSVLAESQRIGRTRLLALHGRAVDVTREVRNAELDLYERCSRPNPRASVLSC